MNIVKKYNLDDLSIDRIINMAWEDRTPFEAIQFQFGLSESEVICLMKQEMRLKNWQKWRSRVQGRKTKHRKLRSKEVVRFKAAAQKMIAGNVISKKQY